MGRNELMTIAQRLHEYVGNPHHIDPISDAFKQLISDASEALSQAAQPQGDPVAWQYRVSAGPQTGWSLWHDGKGEEFKQSYQVETRPLYAEQPAPLAVNSRAMTELRDIFDSNKGADGTLVISKKLAAQILGTK